ncbi:sulfite exporter TauE/SafE family protein [Hahella ganghwensis]|uniref:urease accessory protein UreH domain-containing protein n=1 Tax=Hahella ganghwensis TaxID=286420 RepID=UPI0003719C1A|nr:sulfite exporter TauE/SafE family protein [Hahella ganghwensis]
MLSSSIALIGAGFSLGFVHALDPDHVMAVSALSSEKTGIRRTLLYCASWALGHGGVLLACGLLLFGLGFRLPEALQISAEASVGILLIAIGIMCFWRYRSRSGEGSELEKNRLLKTRGQTGKPRAPLMVGMLHGLAGSASALALVPVITQGQLVIAVAYILVFSLGVLLSMLCFGLGLGTVQLKLQRFSERWFRWNQYLIASVSVVLGSYWLSQVV